MQPTENYEPNDFDEDRQRIVLSERDYVRFVALIKNPPAPTQALKDAMVEYDRLKEAHPEANL